MTAKKSGSQFAPGQVSLRAFARSIGVSETAVRKAIDAGRLTHSLGKTAGGRPCVADLAAATAEWNASSRTATGVRTEPPAGSQLGSTVPSGDFEVGETMLPIVSEAELSELQVYGTTLIDAQTKATRERARKLKYENDVTEGRLVPIEVVTKEAFEATRIIRETLLNLPARIAGELAAETDIARVHRRLEAAIHDALTATAGALVAER